MEFLLIFSDEFHDKLLQKPPEDILKECLKLFMRQVKWIFQTVEVGKKEQQVEEWQAKF